MSDKPNSIIIIDSEVWFCVWAVTLIAGLRTKPRIVVEYNINKAIVMFHLL